MVLGTDNTYLNISNLRNDTILSLNLCNTSIDSDILTLIGPKLYFDCIHSSQFNNVTLRERPRKTEESHLTVFNENGYNFSKVLLDTRNYIKDDEPLVLYEHSFGISTQDWCDGDLQPPLFEKHSGVEDINNAVLSELQNIVSELRSIKSLIDNGITTNYTKFSNTNDSNDKPTTADPYDSDQTQATSEIYDSSNT